MMAAEGQSERVPTVVVVMIVAGALALAAWLVVSAPERQKAEEERAERERERQREVAREEALAGCREVETRIMVERQQGADAVTMAKQEATLRDCLSQHEPSKMWRADLVAARGAQQQIAAEWAHLLSTDYADTLKRGSTRATWLRIGEGAIRSLRTAIAGAKTTADLDEIRDVAREIAQESWRRVAKFDSSPDGASGGAARYFASVESSREDKAGDEIARIIAPIIGTNPAATGTQQDHAKHNGNRPDSVIVDGPDGRVDLLRWDRLAIDGVDARSVSPMVVLRGAGWSRWAQWVRAGRGSVFDAIDARRDELTAAAMRVASGVSVGRLLTASAVIDLSAFSAAKG